jgi:hypothetical protein
MLLAGFELTIPVSERPQTHALDRAATVIAISFYQTSYNRDMKSFYSQNLLNIFHSKLTIFERTRSLRMQLNVTSDMYKVQIFKT